MTKNIQPKNQIHPSVKRIFYIIGGFFVIFFVAVGYTIYIAQKNFEPIMDQRYYEKGLNYEQRKHEFEKSKEKNWQATINILDRDSIKKDFLLEVRLNNSNLKDFFSDPERNVVDLKISYPATMKGSYEFQFVEKEFKVKNNHIVLEKQLQIPVAGFYEFRIEVRPEKDAAMFFSKKIFVE